MAPSVFYLTNIFTWFTKFYFYCTVGYFLFGILSKLLLFEKVLQKDFGNTT